MISLKPNTASGGEHRLCPCRLVLARVIQSIIPGISSILRRALYQAVIARAAEFGSKLGSKGERIGPRAEWRPQALQWTFNAWRAEVGHPLANGVKRPGQQGEDSRVRRRARRRPHRPAGGWGLVLGRVVQLTGRKSYGNAASLDEAKGGVPGTKY
jgi:hypothetical protein